MPAPYPEMRRLMAVAALLCAVAASAAEEGSPAPDTARQSASTGTARGDSGAETVVDLNPYYSSVGYNIPLTREPIPTITAESEQAIYSELIQGSLVPRYMLLEASVYPLPWFFTYVKSDMPALYRQGEIGHSKVNIFESATAGFQEPWALSLFFGNVARLKGPDDRKGAANWGYTGYLVSFGDQHIKDNAMIPDDWYELEWKIKGRRAEADEKLDWSFRVGAKFNNNRDVRDVYYVGIHRSKIDFRYSFLEWLENTNYDLRIHSLQEEGKVVRVELIGGKNLPIKRWHVFSSVDIGFVWTSPDEYGGALRDRRSDKLTLVFRPGFGF